MIIHVHTEAEEKALRLPAGPFCWVCQVAYWRDRVVALEGAIDALGEPDGVLRGPLTDGPELTELNRVRQAVMPPRVIEGPRP